MGEVKMYKLREAKTKQASRHLRQVAEKLGILESLKEDIDNIENLILHANRQQIEKDNE